MSILCPRCGHEYDVTLFSYGGTVRCECGAEVDLAAGHTTPHRAPADRADMTELARGADRIVDMILRPGCPEVDIDIAIERLRDRAEELCPDRRDLFRMIYDSRFTRLREQWRL